jgi:hypothetical protein
MFKRSTTEGKDAKQREKEARRQREAHEKAAAQEQAERRKEAEDREKRRQAFLRSPAGQARTAFARGDQVFQVSIDVKNTEPIIIPMVGSATKSRTSDPTEILNSICNEGWALINGSFVFHELGSESRDKFLASGQNIAVKGTIVGYYLFTRSDASKRDVSDPWEMP